LPLTEFLSLNKNNQKLVASEEVGLIIELNLFYFINLIDLAQKAIGTIRIAKFLNKANLLTEPYKSCPPLNAILIQTLEKEFTKGCTREWIFIFFELTRNRELIIGYL